MTPKSDKHTLYIPTPPYMGNRKFTIQTLKSDDTKLQSERLQHRYADELFEFLKNRLPHGVFREFTDLLIKWNESHD